VEAVKVHRLARSVPILVFALALAVPAVSSADPPRYEQRDSIYISSNRDFDKAHGVRFGKGTLEEPYVISGWQMFELVIKDTSKHVLIYDNFVDFMVLDFIGDGAHVHANQIGDLRVNQNVPRTGMPTDGAIADNTIGVVGQLRHWGGVFENNVVGQRTGGLAAQLDGFHGAVYQNNLFYGFVNLNLHGHHHGSCFDCASHDHRSDGDYEGHLEERQNHTMRYHEVFFQNNEIHSSSSYALQWEDVAHAQDDRTNASETDRKLERPHMHFTRVFLTGNRLIGAGIEVFVFNARDARHISLRRGLMVIKDNQIVLGNDFQEEFGGRDGISVYEARGITLQVIGNVISGQGPSDWENLFGRGDAGIRIYGVDRGDLFLYDNAVSDRYYGIVASQMTKTVDWYIQGLRTTAVEQRVAYDQSVRNGPEEAP
jgi:hypothetical protein